MTGTHTESAILLRHLRSVHERTRRLVVLIRPSDVDWSPMQGRFSFGSLVRHIARTERWMWAETLAGRPSRYPGHDALGVHALDDVLAHYDALHAESLAIFASLSDAQLTDTVQTPAGTRLSARAWLRAMLEHEAHHRGQLYLMLALRGVPTPPVFGLTEAQVVEHSLPSHAGDIE